MIRNAACAVLLLAASACDGGAPSASAPGAAPSVQADGPGPQASDNPELCIVGLKVLAPGGAPGAVVKIEGTGCTVKDDATGLESVWAEFMLEPAPGTAPTFETAPGAPAAGMYQCRGGPAGNFRIEFRAGNAYANDKGVAGVYAFDPATANVDFTTGPWEGFYGRVLKDGDVGMTSNPSRSFFQMTCEREG